MVQGAEPVAPACTDLSMMENVSFREGPRLPTHHPRCRDGQPIDASPLNGLVPTDGLEAFTTEELAGARHMLDIREPVIVMFSGLLDKRDPGHAESRVLGEPVHEELYGIGAERQVCVEIPDYIVKGRFDGGIARGERVGLGREMPFGVCRTSHVADPSVACRVVLYDLIGPVRGAVADNGPSLGQERLARDRTNCLFQKRFLVPGGRDQDVFEILRFLSHVALSLGSDYPYTV